MAEIKWIKIVTDIFDDEKILLIESMPDKYAIIVCWFKLLCLAGKQNNSGVFTMNNRIAYTDEMLATIFRMPLPTVRMSLQAFEQFGMVEIIDGVITIPNWGKHQNLDQLESKKEYMRNYMKGYREKQKALTAGKPSCKTNSKANVSQAEEDKEEDKDIDREEDKRVYCQQIVDLYHSICKSFPKIRSLSDARRKAINARLKAYRLEDFRTVFENAENSSFLKGSNDRNWSANFDWLIADKNIAKVLEGNYADRGRKEIVPSWCKDRELDEDEREAIRRMMSEDIPATVGTDPELADRAEKLRKELGGK